MKLKKRKYKYVNNILAEVEITFRNDYTRSINEETLKMLQPWKEISVMKMTMRNFINTSSEIDFMFYDVNKNISLK